MVDDGSWVSEWVSINGATPIAGWFIMDKSIYKWIWGCPYGRKPPIEVLNMGPHTGDFMRFFMGHRGDLM